MNAVLDRPGLLILPFRPVERFHLAGKHNQKTHGRGGASIADVGDRVSSRDGKVQNSIVTDYMSYRNRETNEKEDWLKVDTPGKKKWYIDSDLIVVEKNVSGAGPDVSAPPNTPPKSTPQIPAWTQAKPTPQMPTTTPEARHYMKNALGPYATGLVYMPPAGTNLQTYARTADHLGELTKKYKVPIESIQVTNLRQNVLAQVVGGNKLELSTAAYGGQTTAKFDGMVKSGQTRGWFNKGTGKLEDIATHEYGHIVHDHITRTSPQAERAWRLYRDPSNTSTYGRSSVYEHFSETFVKYHSQPRSAWGDNEKVMHSVLIQAGLVSTATP